MNHDQRMDLFKRRENLRMLEHAVALAEAGDYYGFEPQFRGFGTAENIRLKAKLRVIATWARCVDYHEQSGTLQSHESDLLARLQIAIERNAERAA